MDTTIIVVESGQGLEAEVKEVVGSRYASGREHRVRVDVTVEREGHGDRDGF